MPPPITGTITEHERSIGLLIRTKHRPDTAALIYTEKRSRSAREKFSRLPCAFDFQPHSEKCGRIFTAFSGILRTEERMFEIGGIQMDPLWRTALWQQFGGAIDMLENDLLACPSTHWHGRIWSDHSDHP